MISLNVRWREELVATSNEGVLVFELTMGKLHVYFPTKERWITQVPAWASDKWEEYKSVCEAWCKKERIPFSLVEDALVYQEKHQS